jgi:ATP-dependent RNA helicase RhlE
VSVAPTVTTAEKVDHRICFVDKADKGALLTQLIERQEDLDGRNLTPSSDRTKHGANKLARQLVKNGIRADAIHGNKSHQPASARWRTSARAACLCSWRQTWPRAASTSRTSHSW